MAHHEHETGTTQGEIQGDRIILTRLPFLSHGLCYAAPTRNPLERSMSHG